MTNVYLAADTGPSGFGVASKGLIRQIIKGDYGINLNVRTHQWGFNKEGLEFGQGQNINFSDTRFRELLLREGYITDEYLVSSQEELQQRMQEGDNLMQQLNAYKPEQYLIRQWDGEPEDADVWIAIGGSNFGIQAPEEPYSIISTDYNLDIVPRIWEHHLKYVDEVWVPSEWTRQSILNRIPEWKNKVYALPYGIDMNYKPGTYDHACCPNNAHDRSQAAQEMQQIQQVANNGQQVTQSMQARGQQLQQTLNTPIHEDNCLADGKFNFLVVSRFYHIKGLYRTIKAFMGEFSGNEDVRLFVKTTSNNQFNFDPMQSARAVQQELNKQNVPEVGIRAMSMSMQHMYDLFGHSDCFIQASRAECFGIAQMQAAYCGTPVIYTNWSAQKELIDGAKGFIPIDEYEVEEPQQESEAFAFQMGANYPSDAQWASPSIYELGKQMRNIYEMTEDEREELGEQASQYVKENYRWEDRVEPRIERVKNASKARV